MKVIIEILKEFVPLWLALITLGFGYLIFLYTKIFRQTNQLAEKQAKYLKERIDSVDKTTGIFERTVKHQEGDLNRLYEVNKELKEQLKKRKDAELKNLDEQLNDISQNLIKNSEFQQNEFEKLKDEIAKTKNSTLIKYDKIIQNLDLVTNSKSKIEKIKRVFVIMPYSEQANKNYQIIKDTCFEQGLDIIRADEIISATESKTEKIKSLISKSDLIIADVTGNNVNVMYELGFAHGINKPVILLASKIDELRIDVSNYKIILFNEINESKESKEKLSVILKESIQEITIEQTNKIPIGLRDTLINQIPLIDSLNFMFKMLRWL